MKRKIAMLAALAAMVAVLPTASSAQERPWRGGHHGQTHRDWVVRPLVDDAERQSNSFRDWFEHNYDRRRLGRYHDNQWLKGEIQKTDEALERLRSKADDNRPGIGKDQLVDALKHARQVDREIYRDGDTRFSVREWNDLRRTLNELARLYRVRPL